MNNLPPPNKTTASKFIPLEKQIQELDEEFTALDAAEEELQSMLRRVEREEIVLRQALDVASGNTCMSAAHNKRNEFDLKKDSDQSRQMYQDNLESYKRLEAILLDGSDDERTDDSDVSDTVKDNNVANSKPQN